MEGWRDGLLKPKLAEGRQCVWFFLGNGQKQRAPLPLPPASCPRPVYGISVLCKTQDSRVDSRIVSGWTSCLWGLKVQQRQGRPADVHVALLPGSMQIAKNALPWPI